MSTRTDFVAGFILGGLVGAAVALLLAPRSGQEIRGRLLESAEELRDRALDRADHVARRVKSTADELAQRGRAKVEESSARVREALERGRELLDERVRGAGARAEEQPDG